MIDIEQAVLPRAKVVPGTAPYAPGFWHPFALYSLAHYKRPDFHPEASRNIYS